MPEGFNSIADLVLTIESSTEGLESGLKAARNLVQRFRDDSDSSLSGFQGLIDRAALGVGNLSTRFNVATAALGAIRVTVSSARDELEKFAKETGSEKEFKNLEAAAYDLEDAMLEGLGIALDMVVHHTQETGRAMLGLKSDAEQAGDGTTELAKRFQVDLTEAMREASSKLRELGPDSEKSLEQLSRELRRAQEHLENLKAAATGNSEIGWLDTLLMSAKELEQAVSGIEPAAINAAAERVADRSAALKNGRVINAQRDEAISFGLKLAEEGWRREVTASSIAGLDQEVAAYERKIAVLGRTASEAARQAAIEKVLQDINKQGISDAGPLADLLDQKAAQIGALADAYDKAVKSRREAEREQARGEMLAKADKNIVLGFEQDLSGIRAQARALTLTAQEADRLAFIERETAQRRQAGLPVDDRVIRQIETRARLYAEETQKLRDLKAEAADFRGVVDVFGRAAEGAFRDFARGADMGKSAFKKLAASVLEDLAMMTLRKSVLDPLSNVLTSGLQNIFGGLAGARADGGPVEAGRTYLVGERGPELFMPSASGAIIPNGAAPGPSAVPVNISTHIDARGASVDAVAGIRQAMAERDARLRGLIIETVRDAKSRGVV